MNSYSERTYRLKMGGKRFKSFSSSFLDTDLWIGVSPQQYCSTMERFVQDEIATLRSALDAYILQHPAFKTSLTPLSVLSSAPSVCHQMETAAYAAQVGPMAAVAGAFAYEVGKQLKKRYGVAEVVVENGGDIYMDIKSDVVVAAFAGASPLSEKVGLRIPASHSPLGICTSSGTVGHSLSFGKADAVVVACYDAALADAYATGIANKIQSPTDIEPLLNLLEDKHDILSVLIICEDKIGIRGVFDLEVL